jgi:geranylgeranyl diphosphate synthase type I
VNRPLPAAVTAVASRVDLRLGELLEGELARWTTVDGDLAAPLLVLRDFVMSGGKRLRPSFCYWAFVGAGGAPGDPAVIDAGAGLEMMHAAALIHDDVIDGSRRRHGADTVHVSFSEVHRDRAWRGDEERFGAGVAVLVGDLALVYSGRLLAAGGRVAADVFDEMRLEVNVGQYLDVLGAAQGVDPSGDASVERSRRICRFKTAKYTVERPLHLGVALAAPERLADLAEPLSRFAIPLGEAFQLRDDLLGVFGDPSVTGKPVGDDLREGKPTLLASLAARAARGSGKHLMTQRFGSPDLGLDEIAEIQHVMVATGARHEVEESIRLLASEADRALRALPLDPEAKRSLADLACFVAGRDF